MERESFAERLLGNRTPKDPEEPRSAVAGERQPMAESHTVTAIFKEGRRRRGFAMAHYSDYEWTEAGNGERLVVLFGNRALTIEGELLDGVILLLETGRLTHVQELTQREVESLRRDNPGRKPIVTRLTVEPELQDMLSAIKGEEADENRYPRRVK
jgi:hypothetical protein